MTQSEQKIYDAVIDIATEQATFNANFLTLKQMVEDHDKHIETLKSDRAKIVGVSWLGGSIVAIGSLVYEFFFKH